MSEHDLFLMIMACILIGIAGGCVSGIFGGGAGLINVPGFYYVLHHFALTPGHTMQTAITTGMLSSIFLGILSSRVQWRHQQIDFKAFKQLLPGMTCGALLAICLLNIIDSRLLKQIFGVIVLAIALWFILYRQDNDKKSWSLSSKINHLWSTLLALFWLMLGVAVFTTPYLYKCGLELRRAIGTATLITALFSAVTGVLLMASGYYLIGASSYHLGYVSLPLFYSTIIPSCIAGHWGARIGIHIPRSVLKNIYAALIFVVGVLMLA